MVGNDTKVLRATRCASFPRVPGRPIGETDIIARISAPAHPIEASSTRYRLTRTPISIDLTNGAIMAAAVLLAYLSPLVGAILYRPLAVQS
jgi:predicted esterase